MFNSSRIRDGPKVIKLRRSGIDVASMELFSVLRVWVSIAIMLLMEMSGFAFTLRTFNFLINSHFK